MSLILGLGLPASGAAEPLPRAPLPKYPVDIANRAEQPYYVSVKFIDAAKVRVSASQGGRVSSLNGYNVAELQGFINTNKLTLTPEINLDTAVIARVEAEALSHSNAMQPDLAGMFRVRFVTKNPSEQQDIANALQRLAIVEYVDAAVSQPPPPVDIFPTTPLYESWQTYLGTTPGLNFNYAASVGLTGSTMQYVDVEYCWLPDHEDIEHRLQPEPGQIPAATDFYYYCSHGAAATSVISAVPNAYGMKGAAPNATVYVHPQTVFDLSGNPVVRRAEAIISGINRTTIGDALMLEMQQYAGKPDPDYSNLGPAELELAVWVATKAATDAQRVVVAAAGNGAQDLDGPVPAIVEYRQRGDSGAIIVGAGSSAGRVPLSSSTYGSRVNLQGWGQNVAAFGYEFPVPGAPNDENQTYTAGFNSTSSATPLITAAALLVQQRAKVALGGVMQPRELRSYLAATGTPQAPDPHVIGPLPNMFAAITRINEADVGITAQVAGSLATASVINIGSSRARNLVVDVDITSPSVVSLTRVDSTQAVCVGRPPPVGVQCAGQCSYIRCTYPALMAGPGPLTWACGGSYGTPSLTLTASVVSGSHTDPVSANNTATQTAPLSCGSSFDGSATSAARRPILQRSSHVLWILLAMCLQTAAFAQSFGPLPGYRMVEYPGGEFPADPGAIVRELGDLNGDGYTDFAIGAPQANFRGRLSVGKTYVIYGSLEPVGFPLLSLEPEQGGDGTRGFVIGNPVRHPGAQAGSKLSWIAPLGDIDGDGYDDFGLSDPLRGEVIDPPPPPPPSNPSALTDTGALYVFYGGPRTEASMPFPAEVDLLEVPSGAYGNSVVRLHPGEGERVYGATISRLGDFNGDGFDDFAIGQGNSSRSLSGINIYLGRGERALGQPDVFLLAETVAGVASDLCCNGLVGGHDYNGDAVPDLQVCSRLSVLAPSGFSCYVIFGGNVAALGSEFNVGRLRASQGGDGSLGFAVDGGQNYAIGFNDAILAETDLNHDGITDLVYGSPLLEPAGSGPEDDFGRVSVLYGRPSPAYAEFDLASLDPTHGGDGSNGFVLDGPPTIPRAELGYNLARAGDVNNDGIDDLLIGTGLSFNDGGVRGRAYIVFGRNAAAGQTFPARTVLDASALANGFATSIDRIGAYPQRIDSIGAVADLNGDGRDELLLGASGARINGLRYGMGTLFVSIAPQVPVTEIAVPALDRNLALLLALLILMLGAAARWLVRSKDA